MHSQEVPYRHFNNYVKKVLIQEALDHVKGRFPELTDVAVLDLASGRGGDIGKWFYMKSPSISDVDSSAATKALTTTTYECYDVSDEAVAEARRRCDAMVSTSSTSTFHASFFVADCFSAGFLKRTLRESPYFGKFHIVSIQFAFHYACRSEEAIEMLLESISSALVPGGVVLLTTVSQDELSERVWGNRFGNSLFTIKLATDVPEWSAPREGDKKFLLPLGTKYHFKLEGFVDCEEYVVPLEVVEKVARRVGLQKLASHSQPFLNFFNDYRKSWKKNKGNRLSADEVELVTLYCSLFFIKE
ncbi:unnamed protein product [Phytomonas sp. EM1]|nr:unnamed protein product [Phytomonas sp. EM1]|eukprot:CCW59909.1 unnamed protein product [Phytomonas sp. isolate EM1]